jgi:predicted nucleotidyltransferase component of viral defense system
VLLLYSFDLLFEDRNIEILAYNLETVLAEKFETIISRGILNTRARDFYDIYILTTLQVFMIFIF